MTSELKNILVAMDKCGTLEKGLKTSVDSFTLEHLLNTYEGEEEKMRIIDILHTNDMLSKCIYKNLYNIMSMFPKNLNTIAKLLEPNVSAIDKDTFMMMFNLSCNYFNKNIVSFFFDKIVDVDDTFVSQIYPKIEKFGIEKEFLDKVVTKLKTISHWLFFSLLDLASTYVNKNHIVSYLFDNLVDVDEVLVSQIYAKIKGFEYRKKFLNKVVTRFKTVTHHFLFSLVNYEHKIGSSNETKIEVIQVFCKKIEGFDKYNFINIIDVIDHNLPKKEAIDMLLSTFTLGFMFNCAINWCGDMKIHMITLALNKNIIKSENVVETLKWVDIGFKTKVLRLFIANDLVSQYAHDQILSMIPPCEKEAVSVVLNHIKYELPVILDDNNLEQISKIIIDEISHNYICITTFRCERKASIAFTTFNDVILFLRKFVPIEYLLICGTFTESKYVKMCINNFVINFVDHAATLQDKYRAICHVINNISSS